MILKSPLPLLGYSQIVTVSMKLGIFTSTLILQLEWTPGQLNPGGNISPCMVSPKAVTG